MPHALCVFQARETQCAMPYALCVFQARETLCAMPYALCVFQARETPCAMPYALCVFQAKETLCARPHAPCVFYILKPIDIEDIDKLPGVRIKEGESFCFRCHPRVGCFNRCCRNLNLFLYPYDVLRLKQSLEMTSDAFLDKYVDIVMRPGNYFPEVLLRMADNQQKTCPFLSEAGCTVYHHRPDTCRTFPIEQGTMYDGSRKTDLPVFFFRPPDFCLGRHETDEWTIPEWIEDQEAEQYHAMTVRWAQIKRLFQTDPWGTEGPGGSRAKMAFMATYNVDQFRDFVFQSSFFKRYQVKSTLRRKLKTDDVALMKFGFEWVKVFIWGAKSKLIKPRV